MGLAAFAPAGCSAAGSHSFEWRSGYCLGEKVYNRLSYTNLAPHVKKDPHDLQLVNYRDQQAMGKGPTVNLRTRNSTMRTSPKLTSHTRCSRPLVLG